jgi:hypothetical protein
MELRPDYLDRVVGSYFTAMTAQTPVPSPSLKSKSL